MWFWDTLLPHHIPDHPPVHVLDVGHHPEPHADNKSLQEQAISEPGGQVFNKVFQSQESIDQYVAFLLLIKWAKWRYNNSSFESSVRYKSDFKKS